MSSINKNINETGHILSLTSFTLYPVYSEIAKIDRPIFPKQCTCTKENCLLLRNYCFSIMPDATSVKIIYNRESENESVEKSASVYILPLHMFAENASTTKTMLNFVSF